MRLGLLSDIDTLSTAAAAALGVPAFDATEPLAGGRSSLALAWRDGTPFVLKGYRPDDPVGGARERAALAVLDGAAGTPRLLARADEPPLAVLSLLPGEDSLADVLLGTEPDRARSALVAWARGLADVHEAGTLGRRTAFAEALSASGTAARVLPDDFAQAADVAPALLAELGLAPHEEALAALRAFPERLAEEEHQVLSPADTCPDNNLLGADGRVRLLDFEHAEVRHAAWDVAYLFAPWPSCWCAWRIPEDAARAALAAYAEERADLDPDRLSADVASATLGWCVMTALLFARGALATEDPVDDPRRPSRRAFVLHRLGTAAGATEPLGALAGDLRDALRERWGEVPLALAPAFRD